MNPSQIWMALHGNAINTGDNPHRFRYDHSTQFVHLTGGIGTCVIVNDG